MNKELTLRDHKNTGGHLTSFMPSDAQLSSQIEELTYATARYGIRDPAELKAAYPAVFRKFDGYVNDIGIARISKKEYMGALSRFDEIITKPADLDIMRNAFDLLTYQIHDTIYLRSRLYYFWLPWQQNEACYNALQQFDVSLSLLNVLATSDLTRHWKSFSDTEKLLVCSSFDYLKNSVLYLLNAAMLGSLKESGVVDDTILAYLDTVADCAARCYYESLFDTLVTEHVAELLEIIDSERIHTYGQLLGRFGQGMRELDDPVAIVLSVLSILEQATAANITFDAVIDFPYGGIELGYAFRTITSIVCPQTTTPLVAHCVYSSKKLARAAEFLHRPPNTVTLLDLVPSIYRTRLKNNPNHSGKVLLYDNNVTTFATIAQAKEQLSQLLDTECLGAVVAVNYLNAAQFLLESSAPTEPLCERWETALDFNPIADYITAFSTWGTSLKGRILSSIYLQEE